MLKTKRKPFQANREDLVNGKVTGICERCGKKYIKNANKQKLCGSPVEIGSCCYLNCKKSKHKGEKIRPNYHFYHYQSNAKIRNIKFELSKEEFKKFWGQKCNYCGERIKTVGIDRVDSSKGYIIGNMVPCCSKCNFAKRNMSLEEFKNWIGRVYKTMFIKKNNNDTRRND